MELFDEDFIKNEKTDNKKSLTIITVLIIFFIIMVLIVIGAMIYIKQTTLHVILNGQESNTIKNMIRIDEEDPQNVYVPIRKIAKIFNYGDFSGNYITKSEEKNQCYVECENEVAMFTLNSRIIYKTLKDNNSDYEYYTINCDDKDAVKSIDGELYTTIDGIEKAFNVKWSYNIESKKMEIYTMPFLVENYTRRAEALGYKANSEEFTNQKTVLNGMIVVEEENKNSNSFAVLDVANGNMILEPKYEKIEYLEHTNDFLVTSDNKKGIISCKRDTIVKLQYDDIELMDYNKQLYLVKNSNKYGIIDFYGRKILDTDYEEIGIDNSKFKENEIKSKYIIADTLIPIRSGKLWAFFDVKGRPVTEFKYDTIGYITSNNRANSGYSLLVVPDYNVIVVGANDKYTVMFTDGKEAWAMACDSIYMSIYGGETTYMFEYDSNTYSVTDQLDRMGYGKNRIVTKEDQEEIQEENEQENNEENENQDTSNNNNNDELYGD